MSTALVTALRECCGYLQDGGYHQTAELTAAAADEIERLNSRVHALESGGQPVENPGRIMRANAHAAHLAGFAARRRHTSLPAGALSRRPEK